MSGPPHTPSLVTVEVGRENDDTYTSDGLQVLFRPTSVVSEIRPRHGPMQGQTVLHVVGEGFLPDDQLACRIAMWACLAVTSATELTCKSPAHDSCIAASVEGCSKTSRTVAIRIIETGSSYTGSSVSYASDANMQFTYEPRAVITSVEPSFGPIQGGTVVRIFGTSLTSPTGGVV